MSTHTIYGIEHRTYDRDNYADWNLWTWDGPIFYTSKEAAEEACTRLNDKDYERWKKDGWKNSGYWSVKFESDFRVEEYELHGDISLLTAAE
jgi:hypothetical protein